MNTPISTDQNKKKVTQYEKSATSHHQITSQITFARLRSILRGAEDALESISLRLSLLA